jgi:hypothetical protein
VKLSYAQRELSVKIFLKQFFGKEANFDWISFIVLLFYLVECFSGYELFGMGRI